MVTIIVFALYMCVFTIGGLGLTWILDHTGPDEES